MHLIFILVRKLRNLNFINKFINPQLYLNFCQHRDDSLSESDIKILPYEAPSIYRDIRKLSADLHSINMVDIQPGF